MYNVVETKVLWADLQTFPIKRSYPKYMEKIARAVRVLRVQIFSSHILTILRYLHYIHEIKSFV